MIAPWQAEPAQPPAGPPAPDRDDGQPSPDAELADAALIRPFLVTGGRTRPLKDGLRVETIVSALPAALSAPLRFELRRIVELCQSPRSVAEVAVRLGIPLGVTRVLVADLLGGNYVTCTEPGEIPIDVIERIRDRVRAL
jgi:hypothetical protein